MEETVTALNAKRLAKSVPVTDLIEFNDAVKTLVDNSEIEINFALFHCLKEANKRYFYGYGVPLYSNHDGGFTPFTPETFGGAGSFILLEDGSSLLLEDGTELLMQ